MTPGLIIRHDGADYLPVGIVEINRKLHRVLIELPTRRTPGRTACGLASMGCTGGGAGKKRTRTANVPSTYRSTRENKLYLGIYTQG